MIIQDFIEGLTDIHKAKFYHGEVKLFNLVVYGGKGYLASGAKLAEDESDIKIHKKGDVRTFALSLLHYMERKQVLLVSIIWFFTFSVLKNCRTILSIYIYYILF